MISWRSKISALRSPGAAGNRSNFARFYTRFRASKIFLTILCVIVATWLGAHWWFGLDPDFGGINLFLSGEASISLAFFTIVADMQDSANRAQMEFQQKQLEYLLEITAAVHELLESVSASKKSS